MHTFGNAMQSPVFIYVNTGGHKRGALPQNARELNISALGDRKVKKTQGKGLSRDVLPRRLSSKTTLSKRCVRTQKDP